MNYQEFLIEYWPTNITSPLVCDGVKAGTNGLYGEPETTYRNMAHWLIICDEISDVVESAADFIESSIQQFLKDFSSIGPYKARTSKKDQSNGLIGTAWIVEAFVGLNSLNVDQYNIVSELSRKLLSFYPFDSSLGIWPKIVEPNGKQDGIDRTFNHQLWMAASHASLGSEKEADVLKARTESFVRNIPKLLKTNNKGAVYHTIGIRPHYHRTILKRIIKPAYKKDMHIKEWGYHAFNLLGIVRILESKRHNLLQQKLAQLTRVCDKANFWKNQEGNIYGTHYNPVGIEVAVARDFLGYDIDSVCEALNFHFDQCFSREKFSFCSESDQATLNARVYEMKYLSKDTKSKIFFCLESNRWSGI